VGQVQTITHNIYTTAQKKHVNYRTFIYFNAIQMKTQNRKIRVIITDDSASFLQGLELMLTSDERFEVIDRCSNGSELIHSNKIDTADLLLIDIEMPIMNGIEAATKINYDNPQIAMIAITTNIKTIFLRDIIGAGFKGFIFKGNVIEELFPSINKVLENKFVFPINMNV
jgi:DNA-binding NarL/FixJ family response regulator